MKLMLPVVRCCVGVATANRFAPDFSGRAMIVCSIHLYRRWYMSISSTTCSSIMGCVRNVICERKIVIEITSLFLHWLFVVMGIGFAFGALMFFFVLFLLPYCAEKYLFRLFICNLSTLGVVYACDMLALCG